MQKVIYGILAVLGLTYVFWPKKEQEQKEVVEHEKTPQEEALEVKSKVKNKAAQTLGSKGGKASAEARRKKKAEKEGI